MPTKPEEAPEEQLGLERTVFFSDAVLGVSIALLALHRSAVVGPGHAHHAGWKEIHHG